MFTRSTTTLLVDFGLLFTEYLNILEKNVKYSET